MHVSREVGDCFQEVGFDLLQFCAAWLLGVPFSPILLGLADMLSGLVCGRHQ